MSAIDGIPVDKCPKCGMVENNAPSIGNRTKYFCGSIGYVADFVPSMACKRIAELQAEIGRLKSYHSIDGLHHAFDVGRNTNLTFDEYKGINRLSKEPKCPTHC